MADKPADIHTLAPRLSYVEDLATWLKDNRGSGSGGTRDETLWRATLTGAESSAGWSDDPWTQTDLIYGPTSTNELSMHQTVFGTNSTGALKCQEWQRPLRLDLPIERDSLAVRPRKRQPQPGHRDLRPA